MTIAASPGAPAAEAPNVWQRLQTAVSVLEQRPVLCEGIESAKQRTRAGVDYVVIRSPAVQAYLKLTPEEHELLPLMDGSRTLKQLVLADYERSGELNFGRVSSLVRLLGEEGFLQGARRDSYAALQASLAGMNLAALAARTARGFISAELATNRFDSTFGWLYQHGGSAFFRRPVAAAGVAIGLAGFLLAALEIARGRYSLLQVGESYLLGILVFWLLEGVTLAIHELGHGLAVKHAGRFAPRAGVMLYYGLPTAFVDTSDIWMAPRKARLLASFAGPWTGLLLGGLFSIAAFLLPEGPAGQFLHGWSFVFLLNTLLNFNPLLELDGYYLLIDLIERPMLRARSFAFLRGPFWERIRRQQKLRGDEPLLLGFGVASGLFSVAMLATAVLVWRARLWPAATDGWDSGNPFVRGVLLLIAAVLAVALGKLGWAFLARVARGVPLFWARASAAGRAKLRRGALEVLRGVPIFADFSEARLLEVAAAARWERVPGGRAVVRQGEPGSDFFVVAEGSFEVTVDGVAVADLGPGAYFGERALLNDVPRAATVTARGPGRVLTLSRAAFDRSIRSELGLLAKVEAAAGYRETVAAMPLFAKLPPADLDLLLTRLERVAIAEGSAVVREGDAGDSFYLVVSGAYAVSRAGQQLATLGPGDSFGEIALLHDVPRSATVLATTNGELLRLDREGFNDVLLRYLDRAGDIQRLSHLRLEMHSRLDEVAAGASGTASHG